MADKTIKNEVIECLRCGNQMTPIGTKKFDEGMDWSSIFGDWGRFLNRQEKLDMVGCEYCGKVEFFFGGLLKK